MRKYKIYFRFEKEDTFFSSMKMEKNIEAFTCGEACDKLRADVQFEGVTVRVLEVYEQVLNTPENITVLPEDM